MIYANIAPAIPINKATVAPISNGVMIYFLYIMIKVPKKTKKTTAKIAYSEYSSFFTKGVIIATANVIFAKS